MNEPHNGSPEIALTQYGFDWGGAVVERTMSFRDGVCITIKGKRGKKNTINVYVSPTGQSIRVWKGRKELKVVDDA